jgi:two-component system nitrogen regulation response regulator GlnG/two-component system response regulator HydG
VRGKTTVSVDSNPLSRAALEMPLANVLAVAWSADQPSRAGEVAVLAETGKPQVLGRDDDGEGGEARVRFFRQRPGKLVPSLPLTASGLSRRQLVLRTHEGGGLEVESVGQCPLFVNGARCDHADLVDGDVLYLRRQVVLLFLRRPALIPPSRHFPRAGYGDFGEADTLGMVGESPAMWRMREALAFTAEGDLHALVVGGSGTGKELAARAIHALSPRAARPFLARNAATLPPGLIDAELFGNMRNYPNPGMPERAGLIAEADGGTLFLDEIGELPVDLQSHLLRVVDADGEYQRLGESRPRRSSFRLIGATNRDPSSLKHDLLARLTATVSVPSLAERREDIPLLLRHLLLNAAARSPRLAGRFVKKDAEGRAWAQLEPSLVEHMLRTDWRTNTRGIDGLLWRAMSESEGDAVALPGDLRSKATAATGEGADKPKEPAAEPTTAEIKAQIELAGGNVTKAARALGLSSRFALYRLMKKLGMEPGASS